MSALATMPWPQLALALWPLWLAYAVMAAVALSGREARR